MKKYFFKKSKNIINFEVDWSLEPTICILCGKNEACDCVCIKFNCEKCENLAIECVCLEEVCDECKSYLLECNCKRH